MRSKDSYRAWRRNFARRLPPLDGGRRALADWSRLGFADDANNQARLGLRQKHCQEARAVAAQAMVAQRLTGAAAKSPTQALIEFWRSVPHEQISQRLRGRILRELALDLRSARA